jgi:hypothetical protein
MLGHSFGWWSRRDKQQKKTRQAGKSQTANFGGRNGGAGASCDAERRAGDDGAG